MFAYEKFEDIEIPRREGIGITKIKEQILAYFIEDKGLILKGDDLILKCGGVDRAIKLVENIVKTPIYLVK